MKAVICQLALCLALQMCCMQASAHAFLDHARPAVGSVVHGPPNEIRLWFTAPLEPAFCTLKVLDNKGRQVDRKDKQVDQSDPSLIKVTVPPLANGNYRVVWRVLSIDTHVAEGDFRFEVVP